MLFFRKDGPYFMVLALVGSEETRQLCDILRFEDRHALFFHASGSHKSVLIAGCLFPSVT